jgi:uncharacterized repeat protein (TIGR02543 family)
MQMKYAAMEANTCSECHTHAGVIPVLADCQSCHSAMSAEQFATASVGMHGSAAPQATFSVSIDGLSVDVTNNSTCEGDCTYAWDFGTGASPATSTDENPATVTYSSSGSKTISLTVTNSAGSSNASQTIMVNVAPVVPAFTPTAGSGVNAWVVTHNATATDTAGDTVTLSINWNGETIDNLASHTFTTPGPKTITVTATDNYGATTTNSATITLTNYTISGNTGTSFVTVTLSGSASATTLSDAAGAYSFTVAPGTYTVTPSKAPLSFTPANVAGIVAAPGSSTANFVVGTVQLQVSKVNPTYGTVNSSPAGITCGTACTTTQTATYNTGTTVTLTASAATGKVVAWDCNGAGDDVTCASGATTCTTDVVMSAANACTATFALPTATTRTLTVSAVEPPTWNAKGTVTGTGIYCGKNTAADDCDQAGLANNTLVTLTAYPAAGYTFTGWTGTCYSNPAPNKCTVKMDNDKTVSPNWAP